MREKSEILNHAPYFLCDICWVTLIGEEPGLAIDYRVFDAAVATPDRRLAELVSLNNHKTEALEVVVDLIIVRVERNEGANRI
jgi:hypothetical protein